MRGWEDGDVVLLHETFLSWVVSRGSIGMQGVEAAGFVVACVNLDFCHFKRGFGRKGWRSSKLVRGCCSRVHVFAMKVTKVVRPNDIV